MPKEILLDIHQNNEGSKLVISLESSDNSPISPQDMADVLTQLFDIKSEQVLNRRRVKGYH